ncbi:META domain-containing protein [Sediminibacterium soli]|uniref:META domain-containing protein n=1 Tax=Sediminibacterium soli TaxID=2698829 RepID=UPI00137B7FF3|nr:META domain-containing protein [Sediminibacterium soli]NCI46137.1 META domain-containing protein [Sediminibacterium soli]
MKYILLGVMSLIMATTLWHPLVIGVRHAHAAPAKKQGGPTLSGEWFLQPVLASDTATGKLPTLRFDLRNGTFTGFTGCNRINGNFLLKGDTLHFNEKINLTRIVCEGYNEKEFLLNLLRVERYRIKEGVLWLMVDQTPVSKWLRKAPGKQTV